MNIRWAIAGVLALACAGAAVAAVQVYAPTRSHHAWTSIETGRYLARAGD